MSLTPTDNPIKLFKRKYRIQLRGIDIDNTLRVHFKVKRTLLAKPNTCEVSVYNLNKQHRQALEMTPDNDTFDTTLKKIAFTNERTVNMVRIEAGYEEGMQQIYYGQCRSAVTNFPGVDAITKLTTGDGEKQIALARISVPIGVGTPVSEAVRQITKVLGVGEGNLATVSANLQASGVASMFVQGGAFYGPAFNQLDAICKAANLEYSVQNGQMQFLNRGKALAESAIFLTSKPNTGMIGSPAIDKKGILKIKTLMIPTLYPGRLVVIKTDDLQGTFRVEQCEYTGDTWGKDWYIESYLSVVKTA